MVATFLYVAGGFIWFDAVFNVGLYANFYGIIATLAIITTIGIVIKGPHNPFSWLVYLLALGAGLFSHYSTLTMFPAIVALPILGLAFSRRLERKLLGIAAVPAVLVAAAVAAYPSLISTLQSFIGAQAGSNVPGDTFLSSLLAGFSFARYLTVEINSDSATIAIFVLATVGTTVVLRKRSPVQLIPAIWLLSVAVVTPASEAAWRFSFAALLPLCFLAAMGVLPLLEWGPSPAMVKRRKGNRGSFLSRPNLKTLGVLLVIGLMVGGSWGMTTLIEGATQTQASAAAQRDVYDSMTWIGSHTPKDSKILSLTDYRYLYISMVAGREVAYSPLLSPEDVQKQVHGIKDVFVAITNLATVANATINISDFRTNSNFMMVYNNSDVYLFSVNTTAPVS